MKKLLPLSLLLGLLAPAGAAAAPPNPFGHACAPKAGVLFCPTASDAERVPSFDGVPMDVDVTLPASGDGPFPAIVMMHGWGGNKGSFQGTSPAGAYNDVYYASRGYAVITPSARGFGRSCGVADSRTAPGCDRGWVHLADHRYEARDTQHLLGLLVDQGVVDPSAIGVTGISYGGIQSLNLARLRNRIRLPDGSFAPWTSPAGTPLEIKAAWSRWGGSDLATSLQPNGRFLDFRPTSPAQSRRPAGVMKRSYVNGLYFSGNAAGFLAPLGADPGADLTGWRDRIERGEPYGADAVAIGRELTSFHSAAGLSGRSAPLLIQNGWTDDLFPAPEGLRAYNTYRGPRVALQLGDLGHARGSNKANADRVFNLQGSRFFDAILRGTGRAPANRSVTAFTQTCPKDAPADGPYSARSWERLHPGTVRLGAHAEQRVTSSGGNRKASETFDPVGGTGGADACATVPARKAPGTAVATRRVRRPFTLLGLPTVRATIDTSGDGGLLAAHLYDVHRGRQTLISRGVYRLTDDQSGRVTFQLYGNGWRYRKGHTVKLELAGRDPDFVRTSNDRFGVRVSRLSVELPAR